MQPPCAYVQNFIPLKLKIFDKFWDNQPNHLPLLNLRIDLSHTETFNLGKSLRLIDSIIAENSSEDIYSDVKIMLSDANWRVHLLCFITILKLNKPDQLKYIGFLWKRLCLGTWVSPQLLVTLSKIDANFKEKSMSILDGDGLDTFKMNYLTEMELAGIKFKSEVLDNKILNSLRYLTEGTYQMDIDDENGGKYAKNWTEQLAELHRLGLMNH